MTAELYIIPESFENTGRLTKDEIEEKVKSLAQDFDSIRQYKSENKIHVNPQIYSVVFICDVTMEELLYNHEIGRKHIDRDVLLALRKIIIESSNTDISLAMIKDLLPNHSEKRCHGLIAFNEVSGVEQEYQIVYDINDWYVFRRNFLGLYPRQRECGYFIDECKKYFPRLFFHERNKETIACLLDDCPKKIIFHLGALNDKFHEFCKPELHRTQVLKEFSIGAKLDEEASLEGNASRKEAFTFDFTNDKKAQELVCCEPHIKLCHNDNYPSDSSYSTNRRIYFHEGKRHIQGGKILIGHIGKHL